VPRRDTHRASRIAGQPGLSECNEPCILPCRLLDKIDSLCEAGSFVQVNGGGLRDGYAHLLRMSCRLSCFFYHADMLPRVALHFAMPITQSRHFVLRILLESWKKRDPSPPQILSS
jgi:hypothetical protein